MKANIDIRNSVIIRKKGLAALKKELGAVGAIYFLRQFCMGQGDYTANRHKHLQDISFDEIVKNVYKFDSHEIKV